LKVGISIEVEPGAHGGIAPAIHSLVSALGRLDDGPETYLLVVRSQRQAEWLAGLGSNQQIVLHPDAKPRRRSFVSELKQKIRNKLTVKSRWPEPAVSDGYFESLGCSVMHFPTQSFTYCAIPTVYNPHDLQHLHYPQFFKPDELVWRDAMYPAGCRLSQAVIVNSQWIKDDIVKQFAVAADKIQIVPEAAPTAFMRPVTAADIEAVQSRYKITRGFAFYPSVTWPHKNHIRLFEALAILRDRHGKIVHLVCTGARHEPSWPEISKCLKKLGLEQQVHFLGFVSSEELRCLYALAGCLVLPTLFEANSLPIFEAWSEGLPVASSNVTALPEQVGEAGLLFDPFEPDSMSDALLRILFDESLREELVVKGRARLSDFDWDRTARAYRAVYRKVAGQKLSQEDASLLSWDWMKSNGKR
jgi:glycosyltransferase involved in cell wall biosynthesis